MILHLNEHIHAKQFNDVPAALRQKFAWQMEQSWLEFGIKLETNGPGWVGVTLPLGIRDGLNQFLTSAGIACVDLEPKDIIPLMGRSRSSADALEGLQADPQRGMRLTADEIFPTLGALTFENMGDKITAGSEDSDPLSEMSRALGNLEPTAAEQAELMELMEEFKTPDLGGLDAGTDWGL